MRNPTTVTLVKPEARSTAAASLPRRSAPSPKPLTMTVMGRFDATDSLFLSSLPTSLQGVVRPSTEQPSVPSRTVNVTDFSPPKEGAVSNASSEASKNFRLAKWRMADSSLTVELSGARAGVR